ncbi:MAG: hypothetical protein M3198_08685 [Actinomycetota bacterium]|nr:hypothetical protein [Actinomycetota bacterium]
MTGKAKSRRITSTFNLGGEQAEADPLLKLAFYQSDHYRVLVSPFDARCFCIGRTGGGKSAALTRLETDYAGQVIRINPEDLSLPYITDLDAIRVLAKLGVRLDPLFIALWKHVLLVEIIRHRYKIDSPDAKQGVVRAIRERIKHDPSKEAALTYLDEFEGKFWCEADERVRDITTHIEERFERAGALEIGPAASSLVGAGVGGSREKSVSSSVESQQIARFQRIVNETQLARLNKMMKVLDEDILTSDEHYTYVVIDDLDRDWVDEAVANDLVRCLFRTVIDLKSVRNLKILVALRTNIFEHLDFGRKTGGQEEKFRALVLNMQWSKNDLLVMLDERARKAAERAGTERLNGIRDLLPVKTKKKGDPMEFILARTLMRPRDAIAFLNTCLQIGVGSTRLKWETIHAAEPSYSQKRLLALRDEWKSAYPGIEEVFYVFRRVELPIPRDQFSQLLDEVILLRVRDAFPGVAWVSELGEGVWQAVPHDDWAELYQPLTRVLFRIGFIGCSRSATGPELYVYDDPDFAERAVNLDSHCHFYIHPAFRSALDIEVTSSKGSGARSD